MSSPRPLHAASSLPEETSRDAARDGRRAGPLRIGLVAPPVVRIPPERYAGTERIVGVLADALVERGHHVTLFASGDSTAGSETVAVIPKGAWTGRWSGDNAAYALVSAMTALEHAGDLDLIHAHLDSMALPLAREATVPVVTTFHSRLDVPGIFEAVGAFGDAPLVAISQSQRRWHPDRNWVATVPHGLPFEHVPFSGRTGEYLVVVGRASPDKGIREAIEVAEASSLPLRIAAKAIDEDEHEFVERYIRPAIGERVEFLGELTPEDRDPLLAGARATLMLGAWPEPFGLVAIESLATGTPVIARRAGALPEIIEHGVDGFLIDDLSEATLAVSLVERLDRTRIRERALERFSVNRMVDAYERLYRNLIAEHAGRARVAGRPRGDDDRNGADGDPRTIAGLTPDTTEERLAVPRSRA